jgi:hypothetical protein
VRPPPNLKSWIRPCYGIIIIIHTHIFKIHHKPTLLNMSTAVQNQYNIRVTKQYKLVTKVKGCIQRMHHITTAESRERFPLHQFYCNRIKLETRSNKMFVVYFFFGDTLTPGFRDRKRNGQSWSWSYGSTISAYHH